MLCTFFKYVLLLVMAFDDVPRYHADIKKCNFFAPVYAFPPLERQKLDLGRSHVIQCNR